MPTQVLMPALSPTMTDGKLARWLKAEGDSVTSGDVLAEIETDKATMEVEAVEEGTLGKILVSEGSENVAVNTPIAIMLDDSEDLSATDSLEVISDTKTPSTVAKTTGNAPSIAGSPIDGRILTESEWDGAIVNLTVREALRDAMAEEMRRDENVMLMGEEVAEYQGAYKVSQGLLDEFSADRVIDTPITEQGFAGIAVGAAFMGVRPIVEFMTFNFAMQAMDQIINSAAKTLYMSGGQMGCPIVFRGPNGAASRVAAQHSQCFAAWYGSIPGLKVVSPWSAADAKGLLKSAIRDPNPVIFLENEMIYGQSFDVPDTEDWTVPIGSAKVVRSGSDVTIVAFSIMVGKALEAAEQLADEGIDAEVIDLRTIRPLDEATIIESVKKTNRLVILEEAWPFGNISTEITYIVQEKAFDYLDAPIIKINTADTPAPYSPVLLKEWLPNSEDVVKAVKKVMYKNV